MKHTITRFVAACATCQQAKVEYVPYPGLMAPLPILEGAWQLITMCFIEGLPRSNNLYSTFVVVDIFSRYAQFISLSHLFTTFLVAK